MFKNYQEMKDKARALGKVRMSVAAANDMDVLMAVKMALDEGITEPVLVGDEPSIRRMMKETGLPDTIEVIHEVEEAGSAL
ncbi:MAG TPA: phosphate acyltransferase, partial [Synergistales bacterium]|nr:phosphate acyltransferase [Synergistales bacterium]